MSIYGQFCPMSKAVEILGERWTLLLIRELMLGSSRFSELQRGLAKMSPSLLSKRLKELEEAKLITRKKIAGQRGYEYHLTKSGLELSPLLIELSNWGLRWVNSNISAEELDVEFLMIEFQRHVNYKLAPKSQTSIKFYFNDTDKFSDWWLIIGDGNTELCTDDPGYEPDIYLTSSTRTMVDIWMQNISWQQAIKNKELIVLGNPSLLSQFHHWFYLPDVSAGSTGLTEAVI